MLPSLHLQSNYNVKVSADNVLDIIVTVASFTSICTCPRHEVPAQASSSAAQDNDANEVLELFEDLSRTCLKTIDKVRLWDWTSRIIISQQLLDRTQ